MLCIIGIDANPNAGWSGHSIDLSNDGNRLIIGIESVIKVFNVYTGREIMAISGHERTIGRIAFCQNDEQIVGEGVDPIMGGVYERYWWNAKTEKRIHSSKPWPLGTKPK